MDILHLVDRLEELFNESRPLWFTHSVIVNEERMLDIIDQMRVSIPEEIKRAQQIQAQKDRLLAEAREEANRIVVLAQEKRDAMVDRDAQVNEAKARAEQLIDIGQREADEYALGTLTDLEKEVERILTQVRNGIRALQQEKGGEN